MPPRTRRVITVFAPAGVGEVVPGADLAGIILDAVGADSAGPLRDGDIVVVTSKIVSKAEGRQVPRSSRDDAISAETARTVARRGLLRIVRTRIGLTLAAAGVDASNVPAEHVLLLPVDPDASAERLRAELARRTRLRIGVVVSDTAGRAWRVGQTDQAIGAAGITVLERYAGRRDAYGNELQVTETALVDELAAAADLAKGKLAGRPVAVVRGLGRLLSKTPAGAADLVRPPEEDLFGLGSQESVLAAALEATGLAARYEELVALDPDARAERVAEAANLGPEAATLLRRLLVVDLQRAWPSKKSG